METLDWDNYRADRAGYAAYRQLRGLCADKSLLLHSRSLVPGIPAPSGAPPAPPSTSSSTRPPYDLRQEKRRDHAERSNVAALRRFATLLIHMGITTHATTRTTGTPLKKRSISSLH
jgi:hypothetical protein